MLPDTPQQVGAFRNTIKAMWASLASYGQPVVNEGGCETYASPYVLTLPKKQLV